MPKTTGERAQDRVTEHFVRDPTLAADIADAFGGGSADATRLIQAATMRYHDLLLEANDLKADPDAQDRWTLAEIEAAASLPEGTVLAFDKRGARPDDGFVTYLFEMPDGRVGKDVLVLEDGELSLPEGDDSPERQALLASAAAARAVTKAKASAADIIAEAKAKADELLREAGERIQEMHDARERASALSGAGPADASEGSDPQVAGATGDEGSGDGDAQTKPEDEGAPGAAGQEGPQDPKAEDAGDDAHSDDEGDAKQKAARRSRRS